MVLAENRSKCLILSFTGVKQLFMSLTKYHFESSKRPITRASRLASELKCDIDELSIIEHFCTYMSNIRIIGLK